MLNLASDKENTIRPTVGNHVIFTRLIWGKKLSLIISNLGKDVDQKEFLLLMKVKTGTINLKSISFTHQILTKYLLYVKYNPGC